MALNLALRAETPDKELLALLRLIRSEQVGPATCYALLKRFGQPQVALEALPELAARGGRKRPFVLCPEAEAKKEIEAAHTFGATMLAYTDAHYPALLRTIADAPPIITVLGNTERLVKTDMLALVGARNPSANGCTLAGRLARGLGEAGHTIVSGLARGIDTAAHRATVRTGTVAVIAGGIDHIYPPENESLYREIAEHGAIISEQAFGTAPIARSFPARNRIIAGMTLGTIVVEASLKSGSLITAHQAADYGREVFAVPGSPLDPRARGGNQLLRNGATLVESADDVLQALPRLREQPMTFLREEEAPDYLNAPISDSQRAQLLEKLGMEPVLVDELIAQCHITPGLCHTMLLELELAGRLQRLRGGYVTLNAHAIS